MTREKHVPRSTLTLGIPSEQSRLSSRDYLTQHPEAYSLVKHRRWARGLLDELAQYHYGTFVHSIAVGEVAYELGKRKGLSKFDAQALGLAGLLHDYGKTTLGERGIAMLTSSEVTSPNHPDRLFARQHVRNGYTSIKRRVVLFHIPIDRVGLRAGHIMAGHHEFQPNRYPRTSDHNSNQSGRRREGNSIRELQRYLAACDQAVGIAMASQGGHSFITEHLSAEQIRLKLVHDREGNKTSYFDDIADDVMAILKDLRII